MTSQTRSQRWLSLERQRADVLSVADQYGSMKSEEAKRLKEPENIRLKKLLAETELDTAMLKDISSGNW